MKTFKSIAVATVLSVSASLAYADDETMKPKDESMKTQDESMKAKEDPDAAYRAGPNAQELDQVVYFDFDSSKIDAACGSTLDQAAAWLKNNSQGTIVIVGHADEVGSEDYNWKLAANRAAQVKQYLLAQGVDPNRVVIISRGESMAQDGKNSADRKVVFYATRDAAPVAIAEPTPPPAEPAPYTPPPTPVYIETQDELLTPIGLGLSVGGGVVGMLDQETRDFANVGGTWEARMIVGTRIPVAFEGAYVGSAQSVDALGLDADAILMGNGVEGNLRVNFLTTSVQPYIFGGLGWTRYNVVNDDFNTSSIADDEDVFTVPCGLGIGFRADALLVDIRGTVRPAFDDAMIADTASGEEAGMDNWSATAKAGFEF